MKQTLAVTPSHGLYLPSRNILLSENVTLGEIKALLEKEDGVELIDRNTDGSSHSPYLYAALGAALGVAATLLIGRLLK